MLKKKYYKDAFERIEQERKDLILEVAIREFSSKGYEKANINVIAKNAGISIGLMYKYFATKEDLFITCLKRGMDILEKMLYDIMISDIPIDKKAEKLIKAICAHSRKYSNYIKLYNEISASKNSFSNFTEIVEEFEGKRREIYVGTICSALADGDLRSDLAPTLFALFLDNLLTTLQFSFTCDYYKEKFRVYTGIDVDKFDDNDITIQLLKFIESAFSN